jgi:Flp pilus assembly pilin Flp
MRYLQASWGRFKSRLRGLHENEDGMEAIQVVMIVAVAALALIAMFTFGNEVFAWLRQKWNELRGQEFKP